MSVAETMMTCAKASDLSKAFKPAMDQLLVHCGDRLGALQLRRRVLSFRGICFTLLFHSILWSIIIPCLLRRIPG